MRDSNWEADFSESGERIAWFLEKEIDTRVDGVIALDLTLAQYLLEITGPVRLNDFNLDVSAENLFTTAHAQIQTDFFPGSTQKKDFLSSLARELESKLTAGQPAPQLARVFSKALTEKHILLYFASPLLCSKRHPGYGRSAIWKYSTRSGSDLRK
jgi:hypothetical protein